MQPLLSGPRAGLLAGDVEESLSLQRGAHVRHGLDVLDSDDVETGESLRFTGGSVTWSYRAPDPIVGQQDSVSQVRRQATLELTGEVTVELLNRRFRVWTEWQLLNGTWARWYLGVFVVTNPGAVDDDGVLITRTLRLADKSYIWSAALLNEPVEVPSGTVATDWVVDDLDTRFGETVVSISPSTGTVGDTGLLFEPGMSWLEVYSRVLGTIGHDQLTADEEGRPASQSLSVLDGRAAEHTYGVGAGKILQEGSVEPLSSTIPNVLRFSARQGPSLGNIEGNGLYTVVNQSTGPASIDSRGFEVEQRIDVDAADQAALEAIGDADKQRYFAGGGLRFSGQVALNPRHSDRDVIALSLPRLDVDGTTWLVTDWTYPLRDLQDSSSALMPLTAERKVQ